MSKRKEKMEGQVGRGGTSSLTKGQGGPSPGQFSTWYSGFGAKGHSGLQAVTSRAGGFSGTTSLAGTELEVATGELGLSWGLGGQDSGAQGGVAVLHTHVLPEVEGFHWFGGDPQAGVFVPQADQEQGQHVTQFLLCALVHGQGIVSAERCPIPWCCQGTPGPARAVSERMPVEGMPSQSAGIPTDRRCDPTSGRDVTVSTSS